MNDIYWNWKKGGLLLGISFLLAIALVKPIGVSTQFVIFDGIIADLFIPNLVIENSETESGYSSSNEYFNKSEGKYAKSIANPLNYGLIFVLSMIAGGLIGRGCSKSNNEKIINQIPFYHQKQFGNDSYKRYFLAFLGGIFVLWGARLAGGCTSGHMMSGMMQTSVSGYMFALAAFSVAIPTAIFLYNKQGN